MTLTERAASSLSHRLFDTGCTLVLTTWAVVAFFFARSQELWVDETTQLKGLALPVGDIAPWLAGAGPGRFDVPDDRMPPLAYWLGWGWSKLWGLSENSMRAFGAVLVGLAILVLMRTAKSTWGNAAGITAGLMFALSPQVLTTSVEIRAYPLLLLTSTCACAALVRWHTAFLEGRDGRVPWALLLVSSVAAAFTHFFGLTLAFGLWVTAALVTLKERRPLRGVVVFASVLAATALAIAPFVLAAFRMSSDLSPGEHRVAKDLTRLVYRLLGGNPITAVYPLVVVCVLLGTTTLLVVALLQHRRRPVVVALAITVFAGIAAATAAYLVTRTFNALSTSYNVWMVPPICLVAASALSTTGRWQPWVARVAATLLFIGTASATGILLRHPEVFSHTAADRVALRLEQAGTDRVIVVHNGHATWGNLYFPLRYRFGNRLEQYLSNVSRNGQVTLEPLPKRLPELAPEALPKKRVLLLSSATLDSQQLAAYLRQGQLESPDVARLTSALEHAGRKAGQRENLIAFGSAHLTWFE